MLINQWYVLTSSAELGKEPVGATALGQKFVLFRDDDGRAHCLSNVCVHKGGSLCHGNVKDGAIQCPYHGWRYNGAGECVEIPALVPGRRIPKRARVDAYPVEERWGLVWVFLGDLPEEERPQLPDFFPEYEQGGDEWRFLHGTTVFDCNWVRAIENGVDRGHAVYVHTDFGNPQDPSVPPYEVEDSDDRLYSYGVREPLDKRGKWREVIPDERSERKTEVQVYTPAPSIRIQMHMNPPVNMVIVTAYTPVDEYHTRLHFIHGRNFLLEPRHDEDTLRRMHLVLHEDAIVLKELEPARVPPALSDELLLDSDKHGTMFRQKVKEAEARGQAIDSSALGAEDEYARVIPCPRRRADPKNWVLRPVPLRARAGGGDQPA